MSLFLWATLSFQNSPMSFLKQPKRQKIAQSGHPGCRCLLPRFSALPSVFENLDDWVFHFKCQLFQKPESIMFFGLLNNAHVGGFAFLSSNNQPPPRLCSKAALDRYIKQGVWRWERERMSKGAREREREREWKKVRVPKDIWHWETEREYVRVWKRERERECVCAWDREWEKESKRERLCVCVWEREKEQKKL